jgi:DNA-binding transcriptional ArsR family regulator
MAEISVGSSYNVLNSNSITYEERQKQIKEEENREKESREKAKKSPFKNFVQVNKDYYKAEDWLMAKSPIAYRIFKFLINEMDDYNAVVCSYKVLQENFGVSQDTIRRAIKILKEKNYVYVYKSGTSNVYAVNKNIVWNSWGTNYKYAKFGANIILSESEQEKSVQAEIKMIKEKKIILNEE